MTGILSYEYAQIGVPRPVIRRVMMAQYGVGSQETPAVPLSSCNCSMCVLPSPLKFRLDVKVIT